MKKGVPLYIMRHLPPQQNLIAYALHYLLSPRLSPSYHVDANGIRAAENPPVKKKKENGNKIKRKCDANDEDSSTHTKKKNSKKVAVSILGQSHGTRKQKSKIGVFAQVDMERVGKEEGGEIKKGRVELSSNVYR